MYAAASEREHRACIDVLRVICGPMDDMAPRGRPRAEVIAFVANRLGHDFRRTIYVRKIARSVGASAGACARTAP